MHPSLSPKQINVTLQKLFSSYASLIGICRPRAARRASLLEAGATGTRPLAGLVAGIRDTEARGRPRILRGDRLLDIDTAKPRVSLPARPVPVFAGRAWSRSEADCAATPAVEGSSGASKWVSGAAGRRAEGGRGPSGAVRRRAWRHQVRPGHPVKNSCAPTRPDPRLFAGS